VPDQDGALDAAGVEFRQHGRGIDFQPAAWLPARAMTWPVGRNRQDLPGQAGDYLLPLGAESRLAVQQHEIMTAHTLRLCRGHDSLGGPG
jgi:hypothetical protein